MANSIQIKRRSSSGAAGSPNASVLKWGELAFNEADNTLYYGYASGDNQAVSVPSIGGSGAYSLRGGTNASGTWPISITGNAATVTNGVTYTGTSIEGYVPTWDNSSHVLNGGYAVSTNLSTNNSSSYIVRADAIKTYIDNSLDGSGIVRTSGTQTITGDKNFQGVFSAGYYGGEQAEFNVIINSGSFSIGPDLPLKISSPAYYSQGGFFNDPNTEIATIGYVSDVIASGFNANDAMQFKGVVTQASGLPSGLVSAGWTYRVAQAGNYAGEVTEVGDMIISISDALGSVNSTWSVVQTNLDGAVLNTRNINTGNGLTGGGNLSSDRTLSVVAGSGLTVDTNGVHIGVNGGITLNNDSIAVDSTVVRTSGNQTINGIKSFENLAYFYNGVAVSGGSLDIYQTDVGVSFRVTETGTVSSGTWGASTIAVNKGGTGQTSYTDGQLLIGNSTGNTLTKATLSAGTSIGITNGAGSITINHADTSNLSGAQGTDGIASITVDGLGHVTAVTTASYITSASLCSSIANCPIDGGTF